MKSIAVWKIKNDSVVPIDLPIQPHTLDQVSKFLPGGAYTTFRTYQKTKALNLSDHLLRLQESARLSSFSVNVHQQDIRKAVRECLDVLPVDEARLRVILDLEENPGEIYLLMEELIPPDPQLYQHGVWVVTRRFARRNPKAKQTSFIQEADKIRQNLAEGVYEAVMVADDGSLLEGLSSNFFAVKESQLWTAEEGVLPGITRSIVLEQATQAGIHVVQKAVSVSEISQLQEAFMTSSSRGVLPIRQVDDQLIGNGLPGPITRLLRENYEKELRRLVEPI